MRILSKFRDYYDIGLANGYDASIVYSRSTEMINAKDHEARHAALVQRLRNAVPTQRRDYARNQTFEFFLVLLGGRSYPGVQVLSYPKGVFVSEHWYGRDKILDALTDARPSRLRDLFSRERTASIESFLDLDGGEQFMDELIAARLPLVHADHREGAPYFTKDPSLKHIQFGKRLDAWSVFQELSMFLGGILAPENRATIAISDQDRLVQHGFNDISFRKRKAA